MKISSSQTNQSIRLKFYTFIVLGSGHVPRKFQPYTTIRVGVMNFQSQHPSETIRRG